MSHVDDGQIHMILDGALDLVGEVRAAEVRAHLEACSDCRARLEEEAEVRTRAGTLLEESGPGPLKVPSLEDLRREAAGRERGGVGTGRRVPRAMVLAWAASVVLALGLGLYGPGLWERSQAVSSSAGAGGPPSSMAGPGDRIEASGQVPEEEPMDAASPAPGEEEGGKGIETRGASESPAPLDRGDAGAGAEAPGGRAAGPPVEPAETSLRDAAGVAGADFRTAPEKAFAGSRDSSPALPREIRLRAPSGAEGGVAGLPEGALQAGSSHPGAVPGLQILSLQELGLGVVRIRQALPEGDTLVVIHVPLTSDGVVSVEGRSIRPAAEADLTTSRGSGLGTLLGERPPEWSEVVIKRSAPEALVFLWAPRSREFLEGLASGFH